MKTDPSDSLLEKVEETKRIAKDNRDKMRELLIYYKEVRDYKGADFEKIKKEANRRIELLENRLSDIETRLTALSDMESNIKLSLQYYIDKYS
jgi:uncharacterized coiled-coil protein SlyX